jgi:hypothetical protein
MHNRISKEMKAIGVEVIYNDRLVDLEAFEQERNS